MTRPRSAQVSVVSTPYYHCVCRCVRRAFLCGRDAQSGVDYGHRRQWFLARLAMLVEVFAIDLCAYAIMSNHYHLVVRLCPLRAQQWSDREVAVRWMRLFSGPPVVRRWMTGQADAAQQQRALALVTQWRRRLSEIGWFMKCLNEHIARLANEEERCKGRFWESRYRAQALLDQRALLACMVYVDLNPVRAGVSRLPETSAYTSVKQRVDDIRGALVAPVPALVPFAASSSDPSDGDAMTGVTLDDYLALVDWSGRAVDPRKRGAIPAQMPDIVDRLGIGATQWLRHLQAQPQRAPAAVGSRARIAAFMQDTGRQRFMNRAAASDLEPPEN